MIFMSNEESFNRLGISVHRKIGDAARRNRIKRLIREVFRLNRDLFPQSCDVVFTIRPEFAINSLPDMQASVVQVIGG